MYSQAITANVNRAGTFSRIQALCCLGWFEIASSSSLWMVMSRCITSAWTLHTALTFQMKWRYIEAPLMCTSAWSTDQINAYIQVAMSHCLHVSTRRFTLQMHIVAIGFWMQKDRISHVNERNINTCTCACTQPGSSLIDLVEPVTSLQIIVL